jgi:uncharacterized protein with HEPN domain
VPSRHNSAEALADIIENAERIEGYVVGMNREAFALDGRTRDAVERCLESICGAAHCLGEQATELVPGQPWRDIRGMGNRLRHAYDRISPSVIWDAVRHDLPGLVAEARQTLERLRA